MLLVLLGGAALADFATTALAVSLWGIRAEANPVYTALFLNLGYVGLALPKIALLPLWFLRRLKRGQVAIGFAIGLQTLAAAWNLGQTVWVLTLLHS